MSFENELKRVMAHGILHFCGYKDKTKEEKSIMRSKEEEKIALF
ncbi:Metal-dependent hydrolase YbeY, involved in rRNA and/or ribosome maturation and assembly [Christiangramia flava JLT2011]|uniref:Metal-dependent hydrolase YbeY, involved in rRNA and/or ribosome maturation and assembly n=1 Tax=Christiangramia flava JLT2011 TaxID=1229726 RepID=A0A1L7I240_9FLAO|nr:Metal-dependent hydrolase YbeY, involved in rRNA and/or ribosome maturation and assembly [Christiangramia flava JLT2011]